jgi:hypothetical protein
MLGTLLVVVPPLVVVVLPPVILPLLALPIADVLLVLPCAYVLPMCNTDKPATIATIDMIAIKFNLFMQDYYKLELYNNSSSLEDFLEHFYLVIYE